MTTIFLINQVTCFNLIDKVELAGERTPKSADFLDDKEKVDLSSQEDRHEGYIRKDGNHLPFEAVEK
jgi:hypothetical protein